MAASEKTVDDLVEIIIMRYVPLYRHESMMKDLKSIKGNKSFTDTIKKIDKRLKQGEK